MAACGLDDAGALQQDLESENALSLNALSLNALSLNALSLNALSLNALSLNALSLNGIGDSADGRELLSYIARCALPAGGVLATESGGVQYQFPGLLGLASAWELRGLTETEQRAVSACLMAHVNAYGVSLPISIRLEGIADVSEDEKNRYSRYEGAFFGNLFSDSPQLYSCWGDSPPDFSKDYPEHDTNEGDRLLRRCVDSTDDEPGPTVCSFTSVGPCSDVCDRQNGNSLSDCWTDKDRTGERFEETVSVWLLVHDDPDSRWPELYDDSYGDE